MTNTERKELFEAVDALDYLYRVATGAGRDAGATLTMR